MVCETCKITITRLRENSGKRGGLLPGANISEHDFRLPVEGQVCLWHAFVFHPARDSRPTGTGERNAKRVGRNKPPVRLRSGSISLRFRRSTNDNDRSCVRHGRTRAVVVNQWMRRDNGPLFGDDERLVAGGSSWTASEVSKAKNCVCLRFCFARPRHRVRSIAFGSMTVCESRGTEISASNTRANVKHSCAERARWEREEKIWCCRTIGVSKVHKNINAKRKPKYKCKVCIVGRSGES